MTTLSIFKLYTFFVSYLHVWYRFILPFKWKQYKLVFPHIYGYSNRGEIASSVIKSCCYQEQMFRIQGSLRSPFLFPTKCILSSLNCKMLYTDKGFKHKYYWVKVPNMKWNFSIVLICCDISNHTVCINWIQQITWAFSALKAWTNGLVWNICRKKR